MLNITSYRRKQKYAKPLTIMRQFYYDYAATKKKSIDSNQVNVLSRRTLSVEKFNNCWRNLTKIDKENIRMDHKSGTHCQLLGERKKEKLRKISDNITKKQGGYFKSSFTNSIEFLQSHRNTKLKASHDDLNLLASETNSTRMEEQNQQQKKLIQKLQKIQMPHYKYLKIKNPTPLLYQMLVEKGQMEAKIQQKKAKLRKTRCDWICQNMYRNSEEGQTKTDRTNNFRFRQTFQTTKQNIFPI